MHVFFCVSKNVSVSCAYTQGKREQFSGFNRTLDAINNVFRKFSAFHDETGRLNVDGMNIISNDGSNKLNRSRKARVSYKVQRTINASLNAATSTRAVSSNPGLRRKRSSPNVFEMAATETITSIILIKLIRVSLGTVRHPRRFKIVVIDIQITLKQMRSEERRVGKECRYRW